MAYRHFFNLLVISALTCALASCSSVSSRIRENERQFNQYPLEVQAQIQNGNIDVGFTEDMVYMAKGKPTEKSTLEKKDTSGNAKKILLWKYAKSAPLSDGSNSSHLASPFGYPTFGPGPSQPSLPQSPLHYFIVEFEDGKVARWGDKN